MRDQYFPAFSIREYEWALGTAVYKMVHSGISSSEVAEMAQTLYDQHVSDHRNRT